jgi:Fur family transcriptional regulator, ferric uptake regulator
MERQTRQRQAILNALRESGRSLSPPEIQVLAQRSVESLSLSTVYRQIKAMQAEGQLTAVELPGLPPRYELPLPAAALDCPPDCTAAGEHHHDAHGQVAAGRAPSADRHRHHFHCTACDEVTPIDGCPGGIEALAPSGWQVERHDLTLHGRCGKCVAVPHDGPAAPAMTATMTATTATAPGTHHTHAGHGDHRHPPRTQP